MKTIYKHYPPLFIFFFLLTLLNPEIILAKKIESFSPTASIIDEGISESIIITFDFNLETSDNNKNLILNNSYCELNLIKSNKDSSKPNVRIFNFIHSEFVSNKCPYGKYNLYFGDKSISSNESILLYKNEISLKTPNTRYFLAEEGEEEIQLELKYKIVLDQINRITYINENNNLITIEKSLYELKDEDQTLFIKIKKYNGVYNFTYTIYSEKDTISPQNFFVLFQEFNISYEAIYAKEKSITTNAYLLIQFKGNNFDRSFFSIIMMNNPSLIRNVNLIKLSGTNNNNIYNCSFIIGNNPSPGKINIIYKQQIRVIYLLTYITNNNKCYLTETNANFDITFNKPEEMQYTHTIYFYSDQYYSLGPKDQDNTILSYKSRIPGDNGIYYFFSRISKLSSQENPIDISYLNVIRYEDPDIIDNTKDIVYTHISREQYVNFSLTQAGNVNEIILYNNTNEINLYLNQCLFNQINSYYSCNITNKIKDLDKSKCLEYSVKYISICDNIPLEIRQRKIKIEEGIFLESINRKRAFKDDINKTNIILGYSLAFIGNEKITISFCLKGYINCKEQTIVNTPINNRYITISLKDLTPNIYYIKTNISGQIVENDEIIFKVLDILKFDFNHHYFVKNNGAKENYLRITNNNKENITEIIEVYNNIKLNKTSKNIFDYNISNVAFPRNGITFSYLDNDINEYIEINDKINVAGNINELLNIMNLKSCYYFKFSLSLSSRYDELSIKVFLINSNNNTKQIFFENNINKNIYQINSTYEKEIYNNLGKEYQLYISEKIFDSTIYLYKSNIIFSNISVPEYVINPNNSLYISDISCNLCSSQFTILNTVENIEIKLSNCQYNDNNKYLTLTGNLYNYYWKKYGYYNYTIDNNLITNDIDINKAKALSTFISNSLDNAEFTVQQRNKNEQNYEILFTNTNKDFYMKLISSVTLFQIINNINKTIIYTTSSSNTLSISELNYTISLNISKGNYDLYIDRITRSVQTWEGDKGNTIYHIFNNIFFSNVIFNITPSIFFSRNLTKEKFIINITFDNEQLLNTYKDEIKKKCRNSKIYNNIIQECELDINMVENKGQIKELNFSYYTMNVYFVYYYLDINTTCITLNDNYNTFNLIISIPDEYHLDIINIENYNQKSVDINNKLIIYPLYIYDLDSLEEIYTISNSNNIRHQFKLKNFDVNFLEKYEFEEYGLNILLLPQKDQIIELHYLGNDINNIKNIKNFIIDNIYSDSINITDNNNNDNTISIKFNLNSIDKSKNNFDLYYIDQCNTSIFTGITIELISFNFERHYFVLNNNNKQYEQKLRIKGPQNLYIYFTQENTGNLPVYISYNQQEQCYIYPFTESGTYIFYYNYNGIDYALNEKVFVFEELDDLFEINKTLNDCMYYDITQEINFEFVFKKEKMNNSFFNMSFMNNDKKNYSLIQVSDNNINKIKFQLSFQKMNVQNIPQNKTLFIYLSENNDKEQPLYIFEYKYTNITLNSIYWDVIYSDAKYLLFNMFCNITKLNPFYVYEKDSPSINIFNLLKCSHSEYDNVNFIFKCFLDSNEVFNPFLNSRRNYYYMLYGSDSVLIKKYFYISGEISKTVFNIKTQEEISTFADTDIVINSTNNMFYMPYLNNMTFINCTNLNPNCESIFKQINFQEEFNNTNNNIKLTLYLGNKKNYYNLTQICRKPCIYCNNSDCKNYNINEQYKINSNVPEILFNFNRHYISLENSLYQGQKNNDLNITFTGEDKQDLIEINYYIYKSNINQYSKQKNINIVNPNEVLTIPDLEFGIYQFRFKSRQIPDKFFNVSNVIFIVNNDYELINMTELNNDCIYYDQNEGILFTTLILNENTIFKNYESKIINELKIYYANRIFYRTDKNYGYKIMGSLNYIGCNSENGYDFNIIENIDDNYESNYIFTKLNTKKFCTDLNYNNFVYKDNIVLKDQMCFLNNIYLGEESMLKLNCEYDDNDDNNNTIIETIYYCNINQYIFNRANIIFNTYIKYGNIFLKSNKTINIFNPIYTSDFDIHFKEPSLSIISSNFDLRNISEIYIDGEKYETDFIYQINNNLTFIYYLPLNNTEKHNVTKLIRAEHSDDRNTTIKHIDLNLEIKEIECPEFLVPYHTQCYQCSLLSLLNLIDSNKKYYENGQCVASCNYLNGYGIYDSKNFYCKKCEERTVTIDMNTGNKIYICSCLEGTVKSFEDSICYLPEDDEIIKLRNIQSSTQCYKADGVSHNYCKLNNTNKCVINSVNGNFFPNCICENNYIGKYCEFHKDNINITKNMDEILSSNNELNEANITMISKIRGITYFLESDTNAYIKQLNEKDIDTYINSTMTLIDEIKMGRKTLPQIFDIIELALAFLRYRINNSNNLRNLQTINDKENMINILDNLHYLNVMGNINKTHEFKIQTDKLNLTTFIVYKKNDLIDDYFKEEMTNMDFFKIKEYIDINITEDDLIFITLMNSSLYQLEKQNSNNNNIGVKAFFSSSRDLTGINDIINKTNFSLYISSSLIHFNLDLAEYYFNKDIKIYDKNDKVFVDPCFLSENFDFDLTQKYIKKNIFQKINYGNDYCKYVNFDYKYKRLELLCDNFSLIDNYANKLFYGVIEININKVSIKDENKVYNLPTKCSNRIKGLGNNIAFWFYLFICFLEIIYCIGISILTFGSLKNVSLKKGLVQDDFYKIIPFKENSSNNNDFISNSIDICKNKANEENKNDLFKYNEKLDIASVSTLMVNYNKSFLFCLKQNFKELHPILTLCRVSILSPLILSSIIFVFNTLILFGFNALLYYEALIEKRIYDKKRNNFGYPMKKEFHKIILSILCQICLCIFVKLILIVTERQKNYFKNNLKNCAINNDKYLNNDIILKIQQFQNDMFYRRIISTCIMTVIVIFFFYYSVAFCAVYIKTQRNWFFSGIWTLFWNWVIFAPIYITIISFIEYQRNDENDSLVYYMKRLFFF